MNAPLQLHTRRLLEPTAISLVIVVLVVSGVIAVRNFKQLRDTRLIVRETNEALGTLRDIETAIIDAEGNQLRFLISGDNSELVPFELALSRAQQQLAEFEALTRNNAAQQSSARQVRKLINERTEELRRMITVRQREGAKAAEETFVSGGSKRKIEQVIAKLDEMRLVESELMTVRAEVAEESYRGGIATSILSTLTGLILVGGVLYLLERNRAKAEHAAASLRVTREQLQRALDAGEMGAWNFDLRSKRLTTDATFRRINDITTPENTLNAALGMVHPEDRRQVREAIEQATSPHNPEPYRMEYRVVHRDGSVRWVLAQGASHFDGSSQNQYPVSFDGTVVDITDRKSRESRLIESEQLASAANRSKSEFLTNMSHEIRTPMAAILGYADVLLEHLKDPDNRNCVSIMKRNGEHLLSLINDILDLSRIEAGKVSIARLPCSLPDLIAEVETLMRVRAEQKPNLHFEVNYDGQVPWIIETDATRLRQVLINLIGNAIKFTEHGNVTLAVRFYNSNKVLELSVQDSGIGMSGEQQQRLFKPFSQGDSSVTRQYGGSGLGLAISQRLIRMLGGEIEITSQLGLGSTFTVRLPIDSAQGLELIEPHSEPGNAGPVERVAPAIKLDCRVLIVDDRRDVRHISQHFLEKAGATVVTAEDGQQAIDAVLAARDSAVPFDLIVMDMQMPHVDGLQATAKLRAAGIQTPIIALTADAMKGDRERCLDGGCDDYLSKPIDHIKLVELAWRYTQQISPQELVVQRQVRNQ